MNTQTAMNSRAFEANPNSIRNGNPLRIVGLTFEAKLEILHFRTFHIPDSILKLTLLSSRGRSSLRVRRVLGLAICNFLYGYCLNKNGEK